MKEKVVLAYSGGLDTSITIPWLKENYDIDVIAVCGNVGQDDDMKKAREKFIKRIVAAVLVFLVPIFVNLILDLANMAWSNINSDTCVR